MTFFCNFHHPCNKQKIWRLTALQNLSFLFSFISPSPRFLHKLARKPVHKLSNLHLTQLPSRTQQLTLSPSVYASLFLSYKTRVFVAVEKGSPGSALMALFMDKKCHFQCNSINISGILQGPNGNLWRREKLFAASSFLWQRIFPASFRMARMFFFSGLWVLHSPS